ncbi:MAG: radical SAM family heme chaperone HemW [Bacteroidales bacterium]
MAGIYIHVPFCRQACHYCDFFFTVSLRSKTLFVNSLLKEISMRGHRYPDWSVETLYLGGGTPSLLSPSELGSILDAVDSRFSFREGAERTIECNPEDLDQTYLRELRKRGFNRISIGIQSFRKKELELMHRTHDPGQGERAVMEAAEQGFDNITIDLIYGVPGQTIREWEQNLSRALSLPVTHLSAYHLTFEPGTVFDHWRKKGRLIPVQDEESEKMYRLLRESAMKEGFDHYEISNFARNGKRSFHNLIYWSGKPYLGFGPSAHSFEGATRSWNISSLKGYLEGITRGRPVVEQEELTVSEQYHDYLITSLRTRWGAGRDHIKILFGEEISDHFERVSGKFIREGSMWQTEGKVGIRPEKWLISDHIIRELFRD